MLLTDDDGDITTPPAARPIPWITIRVQDWDGAAWQDMGDDTDGDGVRDANFWVWDTFQEDTDTGLLFAANQNGVRQIEVDPSAGVVRFLEAQANAGGPSTLPRPEWRVVATYVPRVMRVTDNWTDDFQPSATVMPVETITVPEPYILPAGDPTVMLDFVRPERLMVTSKRRTPDGQPVLWYETLSRPAWVAITGDADLTWMRDSDDDLDVFTEDLVAGVLSFDAYRDVGPVEAPLERGVMETHAAVPVAVPYVYWTNASADVPYVGVDASVTPAMVVGPTIVSLFYTSASPYASVDPTDPAGVPTFDPDGAGGAGIRYGVDPGGDTDLFYGALSPRTIPTGRPDLPATGW